MSENDRMMDLHLLVVKSRRRSSLFLFAAVAIAVTVVGSVSLKVVDGLESDIEVLSIQGETLAFENERLQSLNNDLTIEIADLQANVDEKQKELAFLRTEVYRLSSALKDEGGSLVVSGTLEEYYAELVPLSSVAQHDPLLNSVSIASLEQAIGPLSFSSDGDCWQVLNSKLNGSVQMRDLGPFSARLFPDAAESLIAVFDRLKAADPTLFSIISSDQVACLPSDQEITDSSILQLAGFALPISIDGATHVRGIDDVPFGILIASEFLEEGGWRWDMAQSYAGSSFFVVSDELFNSWRIGDQDP